jgi:hypothetical protein
MRLRARRLFSSFTVPSEIVGVNGLISRPVGLIYPASLSRSGLGRYWHAECAYVHAQ